ncbi:hypothetical protein GCM10008090_25540 [Arenicella chitinivorans]|uniref:HEAT repeat domain-containing protein n=1 Tax=Arenicella chitinivorans TaxID=1329800 RepID=A0A918RYZ4_9GAMM|nr:hypothetical protein [Arenicella chitinivorans]GHA14628.1 hypothetical protein GCM10008090_25540 [Arenicella chitinivorans]
MLKSFPLLFVIALSLICFSFNADAAKADIDAEVAAYNAAFTGDNFVLQREKMDTLIWAGYTAKAVYGPVADALVTLRHSKDKRDVERASWYAKTLALSGNPEFRPLLTETSKRAKSKKVRKHAKLALVRLAKYQAWNPVIAAGLEFAPAGQLEETRVVNMLNASDYELVRMGAKRVYFGHKNDPNLVSLAQQRLSKEWTQVNAGNEAQVDAIAWLIKAMAESGNRDAKPLLNQIARDAKVGKLRKYAKKYAAYL